MPLLLWSITIDRHYLLPGHSVDGGYPTRVYNFFYQWFVSSQSGYTDNYWAYQPIGASLPPDLDFGETESTLSATRVGTETEILCTSSVSIYLETYSTGVATYSTTYCARPTKTLYETWTSTDVWTTISRTTTASSTTSTSANSTAVLGSSPPATSSASLVKRAAPSEELTGSIINAEVSIQTDTLVISPAALFLSITILAFLIIFTIIIYFVQRKQLDLLPRDFDCPASLLAAVYASERLQMWAEQRHRRRCEDGAGKKWRGSEADRLEDEVAARMGYFRGADGKEHWGIEIESEGEYGALVANARPEICGVAQGGRVDVSDGDDERIATESSMLMEDAQPDVDGNRTEAVSNSVDEGSANESSVLIPDAQPDVTGHGASGTEAVSNRADEVTATESTCLVQRSQPGHHEL